MIKFYCNVNFFFFWCNVWLTKINFKGKNNEKLLKMQFKLMKIWLLMIRYLKKYHYLILNIKSEKGEKLNLNWKGEKIGTEGFCSMLGKWGLNLIVNKKNPVWLELRIKEISNMNSVFILDFSKKRESYCTHPSVSITL
jgi:hypothetical protein